MTKQPRKKYSDPEKLDENTRKQIKDAARQIPELLYTDYQKILPKESLPPNITYTLLFRIDDQGEWLAFLLDPHEEGFILTYEQQILKKIKEIAIETFQTTFQAFQAQHPDMIFKFEKTNRAERLGIINKPNSQGIHLSGFSLRTQIGAQPDEALQAQFEQAYVSYIKNRTAEWLIDPQTYLKITFLSSGELILIQRSTVHANNIH